MTEITPPARTADYLKLPSGTVVWIQTLNTLQKQDADKRARRFAQNECRPLLKGGEDHEAVLIEVRGMSPELQAQFIAGESFWPIREEALTLYPEPKEPEQGEMSPLEFTEAHVVWEAAVEAAKAIRLGHEAEKFEQACKAALRLSIRERRETALLVYFNQQFIQAYNRRMHFETLWRAVREEDEPHLTRFFESVEALEDADDATQAALWEFYEALDVPQPMVPTLPAQS